MPRYCTAILDDGRTCVYRARPGKLFCFGHSHEGAEPLRQCHYFNRRGQACRSMAQRGQSHCFTHGPRNKQTKEPPIPLQPRTRRQKSRAMWLLIRNLPQT